MRSNVLFRRQFHFCVKKWRVLFCVRDNKCLRCAPNDLDQSKTIKAKYSLNWCVKVGTITPSRTKGKSMFLFDQFGLLVCGVCLAE